MQHRDNYMTGRPLAAVYKPGILAGVKQHQVAMRSSQPMQSYEDTENEEHGPGRRATTSHMTPQHSPG